MVDVARLPSQSSGLYAASPLRGQWFDWLIQKRSTCFYKQVLLGLSVIIGLKKPIHINGLQAANKRFYPKILVHAPDRSTGERVQEVEIYLKFIGRFEIPLPEPTPEELAEEERRRKRREMNHRKYLRKKERERQKKLAAQQEAETKTQ